MAVYGDNGAFPFYWDSFGGGDSGAFPLGANAPDDSPTPVNSLGSVGYYFKVFFNTRKCRPIRFADSIKIGEKLG